MKSGAIVGLVCAVVATYTMGCGGDDDGGPTPMDGSMDATSGDGGTGGPDAGAECGNGLVEGTEACDDGNDSDDDFCNSDCTSTCGDGRLGGAETCDPAIGAGEAGACPADCDDGDACTTDAVDGSACTTACAHGDISAFVDGDGCCPMGGTIRDDDDCSADCGNGTVESGETCDTGITAGDPGACPVAGDCDDGDTCTTDSLMGDSTCTATCDNAIITAFVDGDACCPAGATVTDDADCSATCGNGTVDTGELCDTAIGAGTTGACPQMSDCVDGDPCTRDRLRSAGTCDASCRNPRITAFVDGDMCCPAGADMTLDADCAAVCGNGAVEMGEACDDGNTMPGDGCDGSCMLEARPPTVFRATDADMRDPHMYVSVPFFGCRDITETAPLGNPGVNEQFQEAITMDTDADGFLDLSLMLIFRPLDQISPGGNVDFAMGLCTPPAGSTSCGLDPTFTPVPTTYTNQSSGTCLTPVPGSTTAMYSPSITLPAGPCFVSAAADVTLVFSGITIPLKSMRVAATYLGSPATGLRQGLLMGFVTESDADVTMLPSTLPLVGGMPLSVVLPGGTGNCAAHDDREMGPDGMGGMTNGWWFYLNYPADPVTYTGP